MTPAMRAAAVMSGDYGGGGWEDQQPYGGEGPTLEQAIAKAIHSAEREMHKAALEKIISEVEVAAAKARGTEIYRLARDLRFRFDRATADDE